MEIDSTLLLTIKTYASFAITWGLCIVYLGFCLLGHDPLRGQTSWDTQLAEIKRSRGIGVNAKENRKGISADGFTPLNPSILHSLNKK